MELLKTLEEQNYTEPFETIIVDQSDIKESPVEISRGPCQWLQMEGTGAARSRNLAIRQAGGDYMVLVDADGRFRNYTLQKLDMITKNNPDYDAICGMCLNMEDGKPFSRYADFKTRPVNFDNYMGCLGTAMAIKRESLLKVGLLDENLGTGGRYGSGEETDLVLRILESGGRLLYHSWFQVFHPRISTDMPLRSWTIKHYHYGIGYGALLRKHLPIKPMWVFKHCILMILMPLAGVLTEILRLRLRQALRYAMSIIGRVYGFISYKA